MKSEFLQPLGVRKKDLREIRDYLLEQGGRTVAGRVLNEVHDSLRRLVEHPGIGHRCLDLADDPARFYLVQRYLIVYRAHAGHLDISRISHSSRNVKEILEG